MNESANIKYTKTTRMQKLTVFYLLLYPIISIYGWPGLGFDFIFSIILVACFLLSRFKHRRRFSTKKMPQILWLYLLYWLFTSIIHAKNISELVPLGVILTIFLCLIYYEEINGTYFVKVYRITALICISYFFLQMVVLKTTGILLKGVTTLLPVNFLSGNDFSADLNTWYEHNEIGMRPSSFFTEPAMMAQFLLPLLCIELFSIYKDYRRAIIVAFTIVLLQSGNGYFGLLAIGVVYAFHALLGNQSLKSRLLSILIVIFCIIGAVFFVGTEMGQKIVERKDTILDFDNSHAHSWGATSAFYRIYRGYYVFEGMNSVDKLLGIGNSLVLLKEAQKNSTLSYTFKENDTYLNNIQSILVKTGLIGICIMLIYCITQWRRVGVLGRSSMLVFFVLSLMSSMYFTTTMMIFILIPWLEEKKEITSAKK